MLIDLDIKNKNKDSHASTHWNGMLTFQNMSPDLFTRELNLFTSHYQQWIVISTNFQHWRTL